MKILLASHLFFPLHKAGTEVLTLELAKSLRAQGSDVSIVTCSRHADTDKKEAAWLSRETYEGFDVFSINFLAGKNRNSILHHANSPKRIAILLELVKELSPDLVHFHHINGFSSAAIPAVKATGLPVYFTATDFWTICSRTNLYKPHSDSVCAGPLTPADCLSCAAPKLPAAAIQTMLALANENSAKISKTLSRVKALKNRLPGMTRHLNHADGIFAATTFQADMLARYGIDKNLIHVVPYGVRLGELPERIKIPAAFSAENPLKICFIGSLVRIKGAHVLLESLRRLDAKSLACIEVDIYGKTSDDDYGRELMAHAANLPSTVKFAGTFPHEQIGSILREHHACIVPSIWYENAPLVLCSAIAAGTPVVVSAYGGMTEIIEENVNGLSFASGNSSQLAAILERLASDPAWIHRASHTQTGSYRNPGDYCEDIQARYLSGMRPGKTELQ